MPNGVASLFKLQKFEDLFKQIIKTWKKHGKCIDTFYFGGKYTIEIKKLTKVLYLKRNDNPYLKYDFSKVKGLAKDLVDGATFGLMKGHISFQTSDATALTKEFITEVYEDLKFSMDSIESQITDASNFKWK